jgi:DNA-binding NarL/FixJ family response regulator
MIPAELFTFDAASPLLDLEPDALRAVAHFLVLQAATLKRRARELEHRHQSYQATRKALAAQPFAEGLGAAAVEIGAAAAAARYGVARSTAELHRRMHAREQKILSIKKRNLEIMRLAGRGWPNERIARRVGLHAASVSRIVQAELRRTRLAP